jgi:hypothetical protein
MKYAIILILFLTGCTITMDQCQHDHAFRRFYIERGKPVRGNLVCPECDAVVVSWTYCHPYNGPPDGIHDEDEVIRIGFTLEETLDPIEVPK